MLLKNLARGSLILHYILHYSTNLLFSPTEVLGELKLLVCPLQISRSATRERNNLQNQTG